MAVTQNAGIQILPPPPLIQAKTGREKSSDQSKQSKDSQHGIDTEGTQSWYYLETKMGRLIIASKVATRKKRVKIGSTAHKQLVLPAIVGGLIQN